MIVVGIASVPNRKDMLIRTVESLLPQVDKVYVALNNYPETPQELRSLRNVECVIMDNSLKDSAKFAFTDQCDEWYISWDDDLIAPPDAVRRLINGAIKYNSVTSFHGKFYVPPVVSFKRWQGNYRCLNTVAQDVVVNVIGSGCACHNTNQVKVSIKDFPTPGKADIWFSKTVADQSVPMWVLAHRSGYITYQAVPKGTTIWETTHDYSEHARIMRTFIK